MDPSRVSHTLFTRASVISLSALLLSLLICLGSFQQIRAVMPEGSNAATHTSVDVEVTKKGLGKEAVVRKGPHEWYMLVEVTPDNTVIVRQEKNLETYVVDESETHDRPFSAQEVDSAIDDFVNSVKTQAAKK